MEHIGVDESVEVTDLVLEAAGEKTGAFLRYFFPVFVEPGDFCPGGAAGGEAEAGEGEAAFVVGAVDGGHALGYV